MKMIISLPGVKTVKQQLEESVNKIYKKEIEKAVKDTSYPYYEHKFNYTWTPKEGEKVVFPMLRKAVSLQVKKDMVVHKYDLMIDSQSWGN